MVGTALRHSLGTPKLSNNFHPDVYTLKRGDPENDNEIFWDPYEMRIDLEKLEGMDAVVHLAGENVGSGEGLLAFTGRWTERKRHHIMESRRRGTQLISNALASLNNKPEVLISMSGTGYYGDGGDSILDESAPWGGGAGKRGEFLCDVSPWLQNDYALGVNSPSCLGRSSVGGGDCSGEGSGHPCREHTNGRGTDQPRGCFGYVLTQASRV